MVGGALPKAKSAGAEIAPNSWLRQDARGFLAGGRPVSKFHHSFQGQRVGQGQQPKELGAAAAFVKVDLDCIFFFLEDLPAKLIKIEMANK